MCRERIERAEAKVAAEAAACWRKLITATVARLRVQRDHNTPAWEKAAYYAEAKAGQGKGKKPAKKQEGVEEEDLDGQPEEETAGQANGHADATASGGAEVMGQGKGRKGGRVATKAKAGSEEVLANGPEAKQGGGRTEQQHAMAIEVEEL